MVNEKNKAERIYCARCDVEMKETIIPEYEYLEGYPLQNVRAFKCDKCKNIFFTEEQAKEMQIRTKEIKEHVFGFERKVTVSGKSLVVSIRHELAEHLKIKQGARLKLVPLAKDGFIVQKVWDGN